jgi:hypothetical protein
LPFPNIVEEVPNLRMTSLVEQMLILQRQFFEAKTPHEKTAIERRIDATDQQIDILVHELYGLTEEEISIVEEKT